MELIPRVKDSASSSVFFFISFQEFIFRSFYLQLNFECMAIISINGAFQAESITFELEPKFWKKSPVKSIFNKS